MKLKPPDIYSYSTDSFWKIEWAVRVGQGDGEENAYQKAFLGKLRCRLWGRVHLYKWLPIEVSKSA